MAEFNVRSDSVNVEQIMEQIRERIREKRGVDYTEQQIRDLPRGQPGPGDHAGARPVRSRGPDALRFLALSHGDGAALPVAGRRKALRGLRRAPGVCPLGEGRQPRKKGVTINARRAVTSPQPAGVSAKG